MSSKRTLARKIACGILAISAVGLGSSVLAADITYGPSNTLHPEGNKEYSKVFDDSFYGDGQKHTAGTINDNIIFKGISGSGQNTNINALVVTGNGTQVDISADKILVGTKDGGNFRGFRVTGKDNNILTVHANTFISYTGDEIAHARNGINTINLGSADKHIGFFEAHTTWGKDDYGVSLLQANEGSTVNLYADKAILDGSTAAEGGVIGSGGYGTVNVNVGDLTIDGNICGTYGTRNDPGKTAAFNITADTLNMKGNINIGSTDSQYSNYSRNTEVTMVVKDKATIDGNINVYGNNGTKATSNDSSVLNITFDGDSTITGDINVMGSDKTENATVNLDGIGDMTASKGTFNVEKSGNVNFIGGKWAIKEWNSTDGTGDAVIKKNASVDISAEAMKTATLEIDGKANLIGGNASIETMSLSGTRGIVTTDSVNNQVKAENNSSTGLTVNGTKAVTDQIATGKASLQDLANVVTTKSGDEQKSVATTVTSDANDINGGYAAEVKDGTVVASTIKTFENTTNRAISDMANISLMTWRQENNDMNKRLGELRDSKGENGVWARMSRGESKYGAQGIKNQFNYYQIGYDKKLGSDSNWTIGAALTRTEGNSSFAAGNGENKHTGFAVYGSYLGDNGSFIDLIAKYARMDNDYNTIGAGVGNADYRAHGYSFSAEYGKRFTKDSGIWLEPQAELTYGRVGSVSYLTSKGYRVEQDGIDSLVGRLGFSLGQNIKKGNVYIRASYLYDFDGKTKATMSGAGTATFEQDLGGGWWEVGVGTNLNLGEAMHLYFDIEKTYGGDVATPWQWNAGVRWSF